ISGCFFLGGKCIAACCEFGGGAKSRECARDSKGAVAEMEPPSGRFFFFAPERPAALDQKRVRISSPTLRALRGSLRPPAFRSARPPSLCKFCGIYTTSSRPQLLSGNHIFYRRFAYCASCREPLGTHRFQRAVVGKCLLVRIRRPPKSPCLCRVLSLAILRIRPQTRCGPTMGLSLTPARRKRCVPGSLRVMQTT